MDPLAQRRQNSIGGDFRWLCCGRVDQGLAWCSSRNRGRICGPNCGGIEHRPDRLFPGWLLLRDTDEFALGRRLQDGP